MGFDSAYYETIRGRLRAIYWDVFVQLSESSRQFVTEELDANELGLALEALVDELEAGTTALSASTLFELQDISTTIQMDIRVMDRLASRVGDDAC
jgi:hypothetical protein